MSWVRAGPTEAPAIAGFPDRRVETLMAWAANPHFCGRDGVAPQQVRHG